MTVERRNLIAAMIVFGAGAVVFLYGGILAGLREDWMRMSSSFFLSSFSVFVCTAAFVAARLKDRLTRVEERLEIDHEPIPTAVRRTTTVVGIFMVGSGAVHMTLSGIAGFRGDGLWLGIHLTAFAITLFVCTAIMAVVRVSSHLARLERLLAGTRKAENA